MIKVDQTSFHNPPSSYGNCFRSCLASILEINIEEIPSFETIMFNGGQWLPILNTWASAHGLKIKYTRKQPCGICVATGKSPRFNNLLHAVVWKRGQILHDPHPARLGIDGRPILYWTIRGQYD